MIARHSGIEYLAWLLHEVLACIRMDGGWMTWNTILAAVPVVLATYLFVAGRPRTAAWWVGVVAFALFLPNAPYVLTDLVHLRWSVSQAPSDKVVIAGVLPMYAAFLTAGVVGYVYCVDLVAWEVRDHRPEVRRWLLVVGIHTWCALGVIIGRLARLNSWDAVAHPTNSLERIFVTLSWRGAPVAFAGVWLAIALAYGLVHPLVHTFLRWTDRAFGLAEPPAAPVDLATDPPPEPPSPPADPVPAIEAIDEGSMIGAEA